MKIVKKVFKFFYPVEYPPSPRKPPPPKSHTISCLPGVTFIKTISVLHVPKSASSPGDLPAPTCFTTEKKCGPPSESSCPVWSEEATAKKMKNIANLSTTHVVVFERNNVFAYHPGADHKTHIAACIWAHLLCGEVFPRFSSQTWGRGGGGC